MHHHSLNEGRTTQHWFHFGRGTIGIEWSRNRDISFALEMTIGGGDSRVCQLHIKVPFLINFFIYWEWWQIHRFLPYEGKTTGFYYSHEGWHFVAHVWQNQMSHERSDWQWSFFVDDKLFGRAKYENQVISSADAFFAMPEGNYPCKLQIEQATWTRPRFRKPQTRVSVTLEFPESQSVPIPGKGESSWDLGDDGYHSISASLDDDRPLDEALAEIRQRIIERRERYGGSNWVPDEGWQVAKKEAMRQQIEDGINDGLDQLFGQI